jgi:hypothetical protein
MQYLYRCFPSRMPASIEFSIKLFVCIGVSWHYTRALKCPEGESSSDSDPSYVSAQKGGRNCPPAQRCSDQSRGTAQSNNRLELAGREAQEQCGFLCFEWYHERLKLRCESQSFLCVVFERITTSHIPTCSAFLPLPGHDRAVILPAAPRPWSAASSGKRPRAFRLYTIL